MFNETKHLTVTENGVEVGGLPAVIAPQRQELAECMRRGAKLLPQCFGEFHRFDYRPGRWGLLTSVKTASCALGAAFDGGWDENWQFDGNYGAAARDYCPVCLDLGCAVRHALDEVVAHLNDDHTWTRERIADWLETGR